MATPAQPDKRRASFANLYGAQGAASALGPMPREEIFSLEGIELTLCEAVLERLPHNPEALRVAAEAYTHEGRYEEGLDADLRLVEICPRDGVVWYNLACSYALTGDPERAIESLRHAFDNGYRDLSHLDDDKDLASLRGLPAFQALVESVRGQAEPDKKQSCQGG